MKRFVDTELSLTEAAAFAALGWEQRLDILKVLVSAGPEGLSIGELGERNGIRGSTLTRHLKILIAAGSLSCIPAAIAVWALVRPRVFAAHVAFGFTGSLMAGLVWAAVCAA